MTRSTRHTPRARLRAVALTAALASLAPACAPLDEEGGPGTSALAVARSVPIHDVLTDAELTGHQSVTADEVQRFLTRQGSALARYAEGGRSAAELIVDRARAARISPVYLLARIETESSLVRSGTLDKIHQATGCGCPDGGGCDPRMASFEAQVTCATQWMREYLTELGTRGVTRAGWRVGIAKTTSDGCSVTPANAATAALYTYTPWVGAYGAGCGTAAWGGTSLVAVLYRLFAPEFRASDDATPDAGTPASWSCSASDLGGRQHWTCNGGARYRCDAAGAARREACAAGCYGRAAGVDDYCRAPGWACARSAWSGAQYWTCADGRNLYRCVDGAVPVQVACARGCALGPVGTDDRCN